MTDKYLPLLLVTLLVWAAMPLAGSASAYASEIDSTLAELQRVEFDSELTQDDDVEAILADFQATDRYQEVPEHGVFQRGFTTAELLRDVGIVAVVFALMILAGVHFYPNATRNSYPWLLLIALLILPFMVSISATTTTLEETKTVESCATCHVMDPFVNDMLDPESGTLAARHYDNRWIPTHQCYECHTSYGVHGTIEGKRDGFRHWLLYVTRTWDEPITYAGAYPNANCTACHGGTSAYEDVESHRALENEIVADEVTCTACHGPPHPVPGERHTEVLSHDDLKRVDYGND